MSKFGIVIHGGAGTILRSNLSPEDEKAHRDGLSDAMQAGYRILDEGGSAIDSVQAAVAVMEDNPLFNAGRGAVFTHEGEHEQDACIMDGATKNVGAVAAVKRIKNPILLARLVYDKSPHILLAGAGAEAFASANGMELVEDPKYFYSEHRYEQWQKALESEKKNNSEKVQLDHSVDSSKIGTVGAVAVDKQGNLAAATSTGGMTNKRHGRIGDTPIVGAGTYADNATCAVSATGVGEYIMRCVVAYDIAALIEYKKMTLPVAANIVVMEKFKDLGGSGGVVAIDRECNIAMPFNSEGMYRGFMLSDGKSEIAIFDE